MSPVYRVYANPLQTFSGPVPSFFDPSSRLHREHSQKGQFQHLGSKGAQCLSYLQRNILESALQILGHIGGSFYCSMAPGNTERNSSGLLGTFGFLPRSLAGCSWPRDMESIKPGPFLHKFLTCSKLMSVHLKVYFYPSA